MPHWHPRLHPGPSLPGNIHSDSKSKPLKSPPPLNRSLENQNRDPPLHGVPTLASHNPLDSSRPHSRHGRSHSNPLISIFSNGKKLDRVVDIGLHDDTSSVSDDSVVIPSGLPSKDFTAAANGNCLRKEERERLMGKCATCGSAMTWPKDVDAFRCGACLMINDLKPYIGSLGDPDFKSILTGTEQSTPVTLKRGMVESKAFPTPLI